MRPPSFLTHVKLAHGPYQIMCKSQAHLAVRLLPGHRTMYCPTYLWFWEHKPMTRLLWEAQYQHDR